MNILFIEDEKELAATGIAQLETKGHTVFPAYTIAEAQQVLDDSDKSVHMMIADHRMPDGQGIQFVIKNKELFPACKCAVVSGCLTPGNITELEKHGIPYFHKPLLYAHVVDELRRIHAANAKYHKESGIENIAIPEVGADSSKSKGFKIWPFK